MTDAAWYSLTLPVAFRLPRLPGSQFHAYDISRAWDARTYARVSGVAD